MTLYLLSSANLNLHGNRGEMPDMHMHTDSIFSDKISLPEKPENRKRFFVNTRKHPKNPGNHTFFLLSLTVFLCDRKKPLKLRLFQGLFFFFGFSLFRSSVRIRRSPSRTRPFSDTPRVRPVHSGKKALQFPAR